MDPRAMRELMPDYREQGCPIESDVSRDDVYMWDGASFACRHAADARNHGNHIVSLGSLVAWMAADRRGEGRAGRRPRRRPSADRRGGRLTGVRTGSKGVDKAGQHKPNYQAGADLMAKATVLCEGPRGTIAKVLEKQLGLTVGKNPQVYSTGVKELWEVRPGRAQKGRVIHTMGFPLPKPTFGGGFIYGMDDTHWSVGFVTGLDAQDPTNDPHANLSASRPPDGARAARRREAGGLRRQGDPRGRLVRDAQALGRRRAAVRRQRRLPQRRAAQGHSSRDEVRDARGRDAVRMPARRRFLARATGGL
jgi:electron-transferring-flavoprotein dehydrogenase